MRFLLQSTLKISVAFTQPSDMAKGHEPQDWETSGTEGQRLAQARQQDGGRATLSLIHKPCRRSTEILLSVIL